MLHFGIKFKQKDDAAWAKVCKYKWNEHTKMYISNSLQSFSVSQIKQITISCESWLWWNNAYTNTVYCSLCKFYRYFSRISSPYIFVENVFYLLLSFPFKYSKDECVVNDLLCVLSYKHLGDNILIYYLKLYHL